MMSPYKYIKAGAHYILKHLKKGCKVIDWHLWNIVSTHPLSLLRLVQSFRPTKTADVAAAKTKLCAARFHIVPGVHYPMKKGHGSTEEQFVTFSANLQVSHYVYLWSNKY